MAQFDVFANPVSSARRAWPFVVVLQSDYAHDVRDPIVAPMVPRSDVGPVGRLIPVVALNGHDYAVLMPALAGVNRRDLGVTEGSIAAARNALLAAVDYLFFGL